MFRKLTFISLACLLLLGLAAASTAPPAAAAIAITGVLPVHGQPGAGVTLTGTGFGAPQGSATVEFGQYIHVGNFVFWAHDSATASSWIDTKIICSVPEIPAGDYLIRVTRGADWKSIAFHVDAFLPPSITSLNPDHGLPGSTVVIIGNRFRATSGTHSYVKFGTTTATIQLWNDTGITCTVPNVAAAATAVAVTVLDQPSANKAFTVEAPAGPQIIQLTPDHGLPATNVVITGSGFGATQGTSSVMFGATTAAITSWSDTGIACQVPTMAAGATTVVVTVGVLSSNNMPFTVDALVGAPHIASLAPTHGLPGASVVIAGSDFGATQGTSSVMFGATTAAITSWSASSIACQVPAMASGATTVVVTVGGLSSNAAAFTVDAPVTAPQIAGLIPDHGLPGASVIVGGSGFGATQGASSVMFGATTAAITSWSATSIACQVPTMAAGATTVAVTVGGLSSNAVSFTVETPVFVPTVTLKLSGLRAGALKLGRRVTANCTVTPSTLAGESCKLTVQKKKKGVGWVRVATQAGTIGPAGTYSWKYKPASRGSYRMQSSIAATTQHSSAKSPWRMFRVK